MYVMSSQCINKVLLLIFSQFSLLMFSILGCFGHPLCKSISKICLSSGQMKNQLISQIIYELMVSSHIWPSIILHSTMFAERKRMNLFVENFLEFWTSIWYINNLRITSWWPLIVCRFWDNIFLLFRLLIVWGLLSDLGQRA